MSLHADIGEYARTAMEVAKRARYVDVALTEFRVVEARTTGVESEAFETSQSYLTCRVLTSGYAAAASTSVDKQMVAKLAAAAERQSLLSRRTVNLATVEASSGSREDRTSELTVEEATVELEEVRAALREKLDSLPRGIIRLVQTSTSRSISTSEGAEVSEANVVSYLEARFELEGGLAVEGKVGYSGSGPGLEAAIARLAEAVAEEAARARRPARAFSPLYRGSRFDAILDEEASGALAAAVADYVMAGSSGIGLAYRLAMKSKLALVDNPRERGAPGSREWDDEGVPTRAKSLLAQGRRPAMLNTRLTAPEGAEAGNAYGLPGAPTPGYSNVYFEPGDWSPDEIFEETRRAFFLRGAEEVQVEGGIISLRPRIAYLYSKDEGLAPVRDVVLEDRLEGLLSNVVGASRRAAIFPELRDGVPRGRGGPLIKLSNVRFS